MPSKILLIEADPTIRKHLATLVRQLGYECHQAPSLEAAMACLCRDSYGLVILDLDLLGPDPAVGASQLRGAHPGPLLVGLDSVAENHAAGSPPSPFDAVIPKPFVADALVAALPELLPS